MRKKIFIILILIISCCCFLKVAYATNEASVYLFSNQEIIEKGEEVEIIVNIKNVKIAAYNLTLSFDETKLEYISNIENTNIVDNQILFVWFDTKGGDEAKEGELVKFKFKAKENRISYF